MSEQRITPFLFEGEAMVRVVERGGNPWFVAADVCKVLGIRNATQAVGALDDDERAMLNIGPQGNANCISEGGLYTLILRSRDATKPGTVAHRFRKWVTAEVLPALRQHGGYGAPPSLPPQRPDEDGELPEGTRVRLVTETRQSFGIQAAQQMWFTMKLPIVPAMLAEQQHPDLFRPGGTH
jgi:prophage antirepressor-like protein